MEISPECGCGEYRVGTDGDDFWVACGCADRDDSGASLRSRTMYGVTFLFALLALVFAFGSLHPAVPLYMSLLSVGSGLIAGAAADAIRD